MKRILKVLLFFCVILALTWVLLVVLLAGAFKVYDHFFKFNNPVTQRYGWGLKDLYPNYSKAEIDQLLVETWRPQVPDTLIQKETPFKGRFVNVHSAEFRLSSHPGPWPIDKNAFNVFVFGGSTTYGYGVDDSQTIASHLANRFADQLKAKNIQVYNFGRGGYRSNMERFLFEKLLVSGSVPDLVIFIDGLNDFEYPEEDTVVNNALRDLTGPTALPKFLAGMKIVLFNRQIRRVVNILKREFQVSQAKGAVLESRDLPMTPEEATSVSIHYLQNKKIIESVAKGFGFKTLFVWQPMPYYKYDLKHHPMAHTNPARRAQQGYPVAASVFRGKMSPSNFLWLGDIHETLNLTDGLYVDNVHYSGKMSDIVAEQIFNFVVKQKLYERS